MNPSRFDGCALCCVLCDRYLASFRNQFQLGERAETARSLEFLKEICSPRKGIQIEFDG
jgi:organic radical activating enzyme